MGKVATESNLNIDEKYDSFMEELLDEEYQVSYDEHLITDDVDTVSFSQFVKDIFLSVYDLDDIQEEEVEVEEEELLEYEGDIVPYESDDSPVLFSAPLLATSDPVYPDNVIVYSGSFNGSDCDFYLPAEFYDDVAVIDGKLFNVSNATIYGRFNDMDLSDNTPSIYYLTPSVGGSSSLYNYGSYNYSRDYYISSGRLTYDTVYGDYTVSDVLKYNSLAYDYKIHLDILCLITLLGVLLLCYLRRLKRS